MRVAIFRSLLVSTIVLGLAFSASAFATTPVKSEKSSVVIISQGSATCNSYAIANIQSMGGNVSGTGGNFFSSNASANYTLSEQGTVFGFNGATQPINFAILKSQSDVRIFYYPTGVDIRADSGMKIDGKKIQSASLCYGQGQVGSGESEPVVIPTCDDLINQGLLDETQISCPDPNTITNNKRVIISLDPDEPNWNPQLCTCNFVDDNNEPQPFTECDANATVDDPDPKRLCPSGNGLKALPTVIEAGNDGTWVCTTVGGTRTCYSK